MGEEAVNTVGRNKCVGEHDGWWFQFNSSLTLASVFVGVIVKESFK